MRLVLGTGISGSAISTIPAPFRYFQTSYPRYQRYPGISRFQYLPYRLDEVLSTVIPTIPTIPRYFDILEPTIPARIRYFRMPYPRYPGVLRFRCLPYRRDDVSSEVIPAILTAQQLVPTQDKGSEFVGAGRFSFQNLQKFLTTFFFGY